MYIHGALFFNRSRIKTLHLYRSTLFLWGFWRYSDFLECETSLRKQRYIDFHWNKLNLELNKFVITGLLAKKISMVYLKFQILLPEQNGILIKNRLFNKPKEDNTLLRDAQLNFFARFLYRDKKKRVPSASSEKVVMRLGVVNTRSIPYYCWRFQQFFTKYNFSCLLINWTDWNKHI